MQQEITTADFARSIEKWTDEEIFELLAKLESESEEASSSDEVDADLQAKIIVVGNEIETRFPGQLLAPFKKWKQDRLSGNTARGE
ncbi:hypothetical protein [Rhizobium sullae]|uniref:Uncharacterized protein n=1 Tax=Rhizobium sullae TaxID=50338 RepID=A0A4R3PXN0_RHISU|nr:hypothetical protein [Rhizobium sullae]TCU09638.1 hypothetical protein EV132_12438 [Rhizobium sullae]